MRYKLFMAFTLLCLVAAVVFALKNTELLPTADGSPALAQIGPYRLSADDYLFRTRNMSSGQLRALGTPAGKRRLLMQLIDEEILLQEAQRLNLDKDPKFMKTIESYWKQTLITLLINHKNREILAGVNIYQRDRETFYKAMLNTYALRIFEFATLKDAEMFRSAYPDADNDYADIKEIVSDSGWNTYNYEDIAPAFRDAIKQGAKGIVAENGPGFCFVAARSAGSRALEPMDRMQDTLDNIIREEKFRQAQKEWQEKLKIETPVEIMEANLMELKAGQKKQSPKEQ